MEGSTVGGRNAKPGCLLDDVDTILILPDVVPQNLDFFFFPSDCH